MTTLTTAMLDDIRRLLTRELHAMAREIDLFPDDAMVWRTLPGIANSAGNLAQHLCGNLRHYLGHHLGGDGYVRDRAAEFGASGATRHQLVTEIQEAVAVVSARLPKLSDATLAAPFPEAVGGVTIPTQRFLLHLCTHAAFHVGQAGYLRRVLTGDGETSGALSVRGLGIEA